MTGASPLRWLYDREVGHTSLRDLAPGHPDFALWAQLTSRRIDCLNLDADPIDLIEVKPTLRLSAIGQVLGYSLLLTRDSPDPRTVQPHIVCAYADTDLLYVCATLRIKVTTVVLDAVELAALHQAPERLPHRTETTAHTERPPHD